MFSFATVEFSFYFTRGLPETQLFKSSGLVLLGFLNDIFQSGRFLEVTLTEILLPSYLFE